MELARSLTSLTDRLMEATVVPSFTRIGYEVRRALYDWAPLDELDLDGASVLLTGGNSGLGLAAAEGLAAAGARLHLLVRSEEKGEDTVEHLKAETGNPDLTYGIADLADFDSVERFAKEFVADRDRLDVLVHNAGAMFEERRENDRGIEMTLAVHVVGPFLLTARLLPLLADGPPSRVITVSSGGMYTQRLDVPKLESPDDYRPTVAYARAKRAQVALAREWTRRFEDRGIVFHTMHPGWADTPGVERSLPGFRQIVGPLLRDADQGADTIVWLAAAAAPATRSGQFWLDRRPRTEHKVPWTRAPASESRRLWHEIATAAGVDPEAM